MELTGYKRSGGKLSGGICRIALAAAADIETVAVDPSTGCCTVVTLREGARFAGYDCDEEGAVYAEEYSSASGTGRVTHRLTFSIGRLDEASGGAVQELFANPNQGIIAIVNANSGVSHLVGYSEKFGTERALRPEKSSATTGGNHAEANAETIVLASQDTSKAMVYTGELPL